MIAKVRRRAASSDGVGIRTVHPSRGRHGEPGPRPPIDPRVREGQATSGGPPDHLGSWRSVGPPRWGQGVRVSDGEGAGLHARLTAAMPDRMRTLVDSLSPLVVLTAL